MDRKTDSDSQLRVKSIEHGLQVVNEIVTAFKDPSRAMSNDALKIYQELQEWGWLEDFPIQDQHNQSMYKKMIAMTKFRQLKWQRDHPADKSRSKWEYVMGKARK